MRNLWMFRGLCASVLLKDIEGNEWSLTPGRYVGVAPLEEDDEEFGEKLEEIRAELEELSGKAIQLSQTANDALKELLV